MNVQATCGRKPPAGVAPHTAVVFALLAACDPGSIHFRVLDRASDGAGPDLDSSGCLENCCVPRLEIASDPEEIEEILTRRLNTPDLSDRVHADEQLVFSAPRWCSNDGLDYRITSIHRVDNVVVLSHRIVEPTNAYPISSNPYEAVVMPAMGDAVVYEVDGVFVSRATGNEWPLLP